MSFPPGTEMFQFPGFASAPYGFRYGYRISGGLPHSEICGSKGARPSPQLIAACHVLHRLSVPRHPPDALRRLISALLLREAPRTEASALPDTQLHTSIPLPAAGTILALRPERRTSQAQDGDRSVFAFSSQCPISAIASAICREPQPTDLCPLTFQLNLQRGLPRFALLEASPPAPRLLTPGLGGGGRDRTDDLMLAKHALSQLSYAPGRPCRPAYRLRLLEARCRQAARRQSWWAREDLNLRPHAYQARALTS